MKKLKTISALALASALCLSLFSGCGGSTGTAPSGGAAPSGGGDEAEPKKDPIVIRIGGTVNDTHPLTMAEYKFEELFEAATDGAYDVQVYTNMALGGPREMLEAVQLGNLEMADSGSMVVTPFTSKLTFMDIPYLFSSREVTEQFVKSDVANELYARMGEECNIRPVGPMDLGYMTLSNNVRAIHTPADLKGVKFRVQETDMYLKYFEALGGSPMPMSFNEVFTAAQQGTIDGTTTQNAVFYSNRYYEVIKHLSDMNPFYNVAYIYTCNDWVESLPDDIRTIFYDCWDQASEYQWQISGDLIDEMNGELEDLVTVTHLTDEERAAFVEAAAPMLDYFKETVDEPYLDEYLAEIQRIEASLAS